MITSSVNQLVTSSLQPSGSFVSVSGSFVSGSTGSGSYTHNGLVWTSPTGHPVNQSSSLPITRQSWDAKNQSRINEIALARQNPTSPFHWNMDKSPMDDRDVWVTMQWNAWRNAQVKVSGSYTSGIFLGLPPYTPGDPLTYESGEPVIYSSGGPNVSGSGSGSYPQTYPQTY